MAKKKQVRKAQRKPRPKPPNTRPVFGFGYNGDEDGPVQIIIKDFKLEHIIQDECEEGYWGE